MRTEAILAAQNVLGRILLVEADERQAERVRDYLENNGFAVKVERDGACAVARICAEQPDVVILDLTCPGEDGLSICRHARSGYCGRILVLTARPDDFDQVSYLEVGADDYVIKPVAPRVLVARVRALMRRRQNSRPVSEQRVAKLEFGEFMIDEARREARLSGELIALTSSEFDLLWLLTSNAGRILSREEIFEKLRGIEYDGQDRSIDVRVSRIRPKIGDDPTQPRLLKTVRLRGYLFVRPN